MYVGDSITDTPPLAAVKDWGGVSLSFNGNAYASRRPSSRQPAPTPRCRPCWQGLRRRRPRGVEAAVRDWPRPEEDERRRAPERRPPSASWPRSPKRSPRPPPRCGGACAASASPASAEPVTGPAADAAAAPRRDGGLAPRPLRPGRAHAHRRHRLGMDTERHVAGCPSSRASRGRSAPASSGPCSARTAPASPHFWTSPPPCVTPSRGAVRILGSRSGAWTCAILRERIGHVDMRTEEAFSPRRTQRTSCSPGRPVPSRCSGTGSGRLSATHRPASCWRSSAARPWPGSRSRPARKASGAACCWRER